MSDEQKTPDWFVPDVQLTKNLMMMMQQHGIHLKKLKTKMDYAEQAYEAARREYMDYATRTLPDAFKSNGLTELTLEDGTRIEITLKTTCSINKNAEDKARVVSWLRDHGGDSLVKSELIVPVSQKQALDDNAITYQEDVAVNTNSVKAFVIDQLGQKGSPATISVGDLPKGLNFYQYDEATVRGGA